MVLSHPLGEQDFRSESNMLVNRAPVRTET